MSTLSHRQTEDGIHIFKFTALNRQAIKDFRAFMESINWQYSAHARNLWDVREAGSPVTFFIRSMEQIFRDHPTPPGHFNAYIVQSMIDIAWIHIIRRPLKLPDTYNIFTDFDEGMAWLKQNKLKEE